MIDLEKIEARYEVATPGPWRDKRPGCVVDAHDCVVAFVYDKDPANTTAIAHAREDVPALVAEVRKLREELETLRDMCGETVKPVETYTTTGMPPARTVETNNTEIVCSECGARGREVSIEWGSRKYKAAYRCNRCGNRFTA
jgi:DNA-directed RNA polymerase subunit RPC12/RpoP